MIPLADGHYSDSELIGHRSRAGSFRLRAGSDDEGRSKEGVKTTIR